jgi:16S rRNA processing protein RimM
VPDSLSNPGSNPQDYIAVGRVLGAHGQDGGLSIKVLSDVPNRFDPGRVLVIGGGSYKVARSRATGRDTRLLWLEEVSGRDQARPLQGQWLSVPEKDVPQAVEGEYFHYQLVDMAVYTEEGELLGNITQILETGSNDVYVIEGPAGELLVPATSQVVRDVDVEGGRMTVRLLEGLR